MSNSVNSVTDPLKTYLIIGEMIDGFDPDDDELDKSRVMYKTRSLAHAESFIQSFREGLTGFFVERQGKVLNAFNVSIWALDELSEGPFAGILEGELPLNQIPEVPPPSELYSRKVMVYDFSRTKECDLHWGLHWNLDINYFHYFQGYGKCITAAALIMMKILDPAGEFAKRGDEYKFGSQLLALGWEVMPSVDWSMDQIMLLTGLRADGELNGTDLLKYREKALRKVEEIYGEQK